MSDFTNSKNILLLGASSNLGVDLKSHFEAQGHTLLCPTSSELDITDDESLIPYLEGLPFNLHRVINLARYTKYGAADYEDLMVQGVENLCFWCKKFGITYIHISSDQVFNGLKGSPYLESDIMCPTTHFGNVSKTSEEAVTSVFSDGGLYYIFRLSWLFSNNPCSENQRDIVKSLIDFAEGKDMVEIPDNVFGNPTNTKILATEIERIINTTESNNIYGVYHMCPFDFCSLYELAKEVLTDKTVVPVPVSGNISEHVIILDHTANNATLDSTRIKGLAEFHSNINTLSWKTHLACYMSNSLAPIPLCYNNLFHQELPLTSDGMKIDEIIRDMESVTPDLLPEVESHFTHTYSDLIALRDYFNSVK